MATRIQCPGTKNFCPEALRNFDLYEAVVAVAWGRGTRGSFPDEIFRHITAGSVRLWVTPHFQKGNNLHHVSSVCLHVSDNINLHMKRFGFRISFGSKWSTINICAGTWRKWRSATSRKPRILKFHTAHYVPPREVGSFQFSSVGRFFRLCRL